MKNKLTVTALGLIFAGGSLSAQLNLPASELLPSNAFFNQLTTAMYDAQTGLYIPHAPGQDPTLPSLAPTFESFSFTFNVSLVDSLPTLGGGEFHQNANVSIAGNETLYFERIPVNPLRFVATGDFNIGYFGSDAAIRNRISVRDFESPLGANNPQLLFDYSIGGLPPFTNGPFAYQFNPVPDVETEFVIYNVHTGDGIPAPGSNVQGQENPFNWRIYKMTSSTISDEDAGFVPGLLGQTRSRDGGVYVMLLDDRFPEVQDWDDGFFILSGFVAEVPEPSVIGLAAVVGLGGLIWFRRRKNSKAS